jgi:hypothetical protein
MPMHATAYPFMDLNRNDGYGKRYERDDKDITNCDWMYVKGFLKRSEEREKLHRNSNR